MPRVPECDPYTMVVREVGEVVEELSKMIMAKLPGSPAMKAVWTTVCEASRMIKHAEFCLAEDEKEEPGQPGMLSQSFWKHHGEIYACSTIIRRVADEMGVSNFKLREVPREQAKPRLPGDQSR